MTSYQFATLSDISNLSFLFNLVCTPCTLNFTTMDNKSPYGTEYALKEIGNVVKKVYILKPDIMGNSKGTSLEKIIDEVIVGPRSQQNINILRQYIYSNGLYDLADRITMSECPLR